MTYSMSLYSMSLYYNHCVIEPLGHDLRLNIYTNALETVFFFILTNKI
jgi:hypothetical protein